MDATIEIIGIGTVFTLNGYIWKKGSTHWGLPDERGEGFYEDIRGVPCVLCYPKLGGQFQEKMGRFLPVSSKITLSVDR